MLQKFFPILKEGASVIFLTSGNTALNMENSSVYSASKSAIIHVAKIAARELSSRKIRVNTINPGPTQTEMQHKFGMDEATLNGMKEIIISQVPLARMGLQKMWRKWQFILLMIKCLLLLPVRNSSLTAEWPYN